MFLQRRSSTRGLSWSVSLARTGGNREKSQMLRKRVERKRKRMFASIRHMKTRHQEIHASAVKWVVGYKGEGKRKKIKES